MARKSFGVISTKLISTVHSQIDTGAFKAMFLYVFIALGKTFPASTICQPFNIWDSFSSSELQHLPKKYFITLCRGNNCTWGPWYFLSKISQYQCTHIQLISRNIWSFQSLWLCWVFSSTVSLSNFYTRMHTHVYTHSFVKRQLNRKINNIMQATC